MISSSCDLPYKDEWIDNPNGIACRVLDVENVDFSTASIGRKTAETLVRCAQGGEVIETKNSEGKVESTYTAQPGDAIFVNLHNTDDIYVPGNDDGSRWQFDELAERGYEFVADDLENNGVRVKNMAAFKILLEAIDQPTCIKDAWGEGQHAYLFEGATLKLNDDGRITGIDKEAFDATWEVVADTAPSGQARPSHFKP